MPYKLNDVVYQEKPFTLKVYGWVDEMLPHAAVSGLNVYCKEGQSSYGDVAYMAVSKHKKVKAFSAFMESLSINWKAYMGSRFQMFILDLTNEKMFVLLINCPVTELIDGSRVITDPSQYEHFEPYGLTKRTKDWFPKVHL